METVRIFKKVHLQSPPHIFIQHKKTLLKRRPVDMTQFKYVLSLKGCSINNLKNIDVRIPLNRMVVFSGVSGSGKSSLAVDTLYKALSFMMEKNSLPEFKDFSLSHIEGLDRISRVCLVDQSPAEKTVRSLIATYIGAYIFIRQIMAQTPLSKKKGFESRDFSLNTGAGRCPDCQGLGYQEVEMIFMDPVRLVCESCKGKRFQSSILEVEFHGKNIEQILQMTVFEAMDFFSAVPSIFEPYQF